MQYFVEKKKKENPRSEIYPHSRLLAFKYVIMLAAASFNFMALHFCEDSLNVFAL